MHGQSLCFLMILVYNTRSHKKVGTASRSLGHIVVVLLVALVGVVLGVEVVLVEVFAVAEVVVVLSVDYMDILRKTKVSVS